MNKNKIKIIIIKIINFSTDCVHSHFLCVSLDLLLHTQKQCIR